MRKTALTLLVFPVILAAAACSPPTVTSPSASSTTKPVVTVPSSSGTILLTNVRMATATTGWALAIANVGSGLGNLVRTTDGGKHWNTIVLPSLREGTSVVEAVDVHDGLHAWTLVIFGAWSTASRELGAVLSTVDGGRSWSATPAFNIDGAGTGVQFLDASHGWVFATPGAGGAIGAADTTLYRTVDGGSHWQAIKPPSQVPAGERPAIGGLPEACPMGGPISRPTFVNPLTGWLGAFCDRVFLYVSHDGGLSWTPQTLPPFPGPASTSSGVAPQYNVDSFEAMSPADLSVVLHRGVTTGGNALQDSALYVSHDGGTSWTAIRLPYPELTADFIDSMQGWMIAAGPGGDTERRSLYATADGGQSWRQVNGPQPYFEGTLSFIDSTTGFLVDRYGNLMETKNGGASWVPLTTAVN